MTATCEVCYDVSDPSNFRELSCHHSFCFTCLRNYLEIKIHKEKAFKSILCLNFSCGEPISIHQIQEILPAELFAKYKAKYQESILEAKVEEKSTKVRIYDELFDYLVYKNGWKRCPVCSCVIEKIGTTCDYVNCQSNKCMKKTMICYVCGEKCDKTHLIKDRCPTRRKKVKEIEREAQMAITQDEIGEQKSILGDYVENSLVNISDHELSIQTQKKEKDAVQKKEKKCCCVLI